MSQQISETKVTRIEMRETAARILTNVGTPSDDALSVAESLVKAQEVGHASHGVIRLVEYVSFVHKGTVIADAVPVILSDRGATAMVDGGWGWGQIACKFGVEILKSKTKEFGTATITIKNVNHIGRLGEYVENLANEGLVAMMWCNSDPSVAAFGGRERLFGTNPFAAAIPSEGEPMVIDFATAASAEGKLRVARANGQKIPLGIVVDKDGKESTEPEAFYSGGALLPFGGHKGYCMSLLIELVGGALSGGHPSTTQVYSRGNGTVLTAYDPKFFAGDQAFAADIKESVTKIKSTTPVDPTRPVLLPGEVESQFRTRNSDAITISEAIWKQITELDSSLAR